MVGNRFAAENSSKFVGDRHFELKSFLCSDFPILEENFHQDSLLIQSIDLVVVRRASQQNWGRNKLGK